MYVCMQALVWRACPVLFWDSLHNKGRPEIEQFTIHRFHIDHRPCPPLKNKKNNNKKRSKTIVFAANFNFFRGGGCKTRCIMVYVKMIKLGKENAFAQKVFSQWSTCIWDDNFFLPLLSLRIRKHTVIFFSNS